MSLPSRNASPGALSALLAGVRGASLALVEGLSVEDCALQSMPDASPAKWHLAHTTWFFETFVLEPYAANYAPFHAGFRDFYNSYYHAIGEQFPRAQRGLISRPGLPDIVAYRLHVDQALQQLVDGSTSLPSTALELIELGINHEQQHQELILTDLLHLFSANPFFPAYRPDLQAPRRAPGLCGWQRFDAGVTEIGHDGTGFSFDNEKPRHRQFVEAFEIARRPVSNAEYLAFVEDGGYRRPELWLSEGWQQVRSLQWSAPLHWKKRNGAWQAFTLAGLQPLDPEHPVMHVSHFEADACARWASARLPTEFEWEHAAASGALGPLPGVAWEWTSSAYAPYPGFRTASGAVGEYNGKFMANQYVLRGGSHATPASHFRVTYRNFFPSAARWQFAGMRLARDCG